MSKGRSDFFPREVSDPWRVPGIYHLDAASNKIGGVPGRDTGAIGAGDRGNLTILH